MLNVEPTIVYTVTHFYPKSKPAAITTLREVIRRLGYSIPVSATNQPKKIISANADWDCHLTHTTREIRAVIRIYQPDVTPIALEGELPYLSIADYR